MAYAIRIIISLILHLDEKVRSQAKRFQSKLTENVRMPLKTELLSIKQIAMQFDMGVSTIWRLVKIKKFPTPIKVGGSTRWRVQDLEEWLAGRSNASGQVADRLPPT